VVETCQDTTSRAKPSRPTLNSLMLDARTRKFTCLLVWKLDRFGRSLVDCLNNIRFLEEHGIRFVAVTQALDTDNTEPRLSVPAPRFGRGRGIRAILNPGTDPGREVTLPAGL
jgi:site-specific DNA recombinase